MVYEIKSDKKVNFIDVKQALEKKILQFLGELGYGKAGVTILDEWQDNKGMIKVNTKSSDQVKTALTMVEKLDNQRIMIKIIGVSGILNKAKIRFMKGGR